MQQSPHSPVARSAHQGQSATELTFRPESPNIFNAGPLGELAQAKIRCGMNLLLVALGCFACWMQPSLEWRLVGYTFLFTAASALALFAWAKLIVERPPNDYRRLGQRIASIIIDNVSISWILYFGDEILAGAFAVYLWVTIGYGVRYGPGYLYGSLSASMVGFILVALTSNFWRSFPALTVGLGVGLLIVPLYVSYLVTLLYGALAKAEAGARAKADFVAKMSHELRTPLHGVIALSELLRGEITDAQRSEMTRMISTSSNTLLELINSILDISKYESGCFALQIEDMELHQVLAETVDLLLPHSSSKGLSLSLYFDTRLESRLLGSPRQIQEVIVNLGGNAIKFTDKGSVQVHVTLPKVPRGPDSLTISIVDTGPGMDSDYLNRVFDPFSQADDSVTRQHGGSGLGTTIARDLIDLMAGELKIRSAPGVGTRVDVELELPRQQLTADVALTVLPELIALIGLGTEGREIRKRFDNLPGVVIREFSIGELHRLLPTLTTQTCYITNSEDAGTLLPILRADLARKGRQSIPVVFGYGLENERQVAVDAGLTSFISSAASDAELTRALHLAGKLLPAAAPDLKLTNDDEYKGLILIAEDNSTNQVIAQMTLERAGYRCYVVADGEKALEELQTGAYDMALIDMHMPLMDGLDVARLYNFISATERFRTPIVMVTADNRPELVAEADLAGITKFAVKPLRPSQLIKTVQELMLKRHDDLSSVDPDAYVQPDNELEETPDIDEPLFAELMEYMNFEDAELFYGEFTEDAERYIQTVRQAMEGEVGATRMRDHMHALCGSARTVGAMKLAAIARRVEYSKDAEIRSDCRKYSDQLSDVLNRTMAEVNRRLDLREAAMPSDAEPG